MYIIDNDCNVPNNEISVWQKEKKLWVKEKECTIPLVHFHMLHMENQIYLLLIIDQHNIFKFKNIPRTLSCRVLTWFSELSLINFYFNISFHWKFNKSKLILNILPKFTLLLFKRQVDMLSVVYFNLEDIFNIVIRTIKFWKFPSLVQKKHDPHIVPLPNDATIIL